MDAKRDGLKEQCTMRLGSCNKFKKRGGGFCLRASKEKSIKNASRQFHFGKNVQYTCIYVTARYSNFIFLIHFNLQGEGRGWAVRAFSMCFVHCLGFCIQFEIHFMEIDRKFLVSSVGIFLYQIIVLIRWSTGCKGKGQVR